MITRFTLCFSLSLVALALFASFSTAQVIHYEQNFDGLQEGDLDGQDGWAMGRQPTFRRLT